MKKIIIISATSSTNLELSNKILNILNEFDVQSKIINSEDYQLPLFVASEYENKKELDQKENKLLK